MVTLTAEIKKGGQWAAAFSVFHTDNDSGTIELKFADGRIKFLQIAKDENGRTIMLENLKFIGAKTGYKLYFVDSTRIPE